EPLHLRGDPAHLDGLGLGRRGARVARGPDAAALVPLGARQGDRAAAALLARARIRLRHEPAVARDDRVAALVVEQAAPELDGRGPRLGAALLERAVELVP